MTQNLKQEEEKSPQTTGRGHLTRLIARATLDMRVNNKKIGKDRLLNLAEYMVYWPDDYSEEEREVAAKLLGFYGLESLVVPRDADSLIRSKIRSQINREYQKSWTTRTPTGRNGK